MKQLITILFILFSFSLFAQNDEIPSNVSNLFPGAKLQWSKYYKGRIDDLSDVAIVLGSDGKFCRGYMTYLRSKESFILDGTFVGDTLTLTELDKNKSTSGFVKAIKKGNRLIGNWRNFNNTIGGIQIVLTEVQELPSIPSFCGDNKWIHGYRGAFGDKEVEILLQKGSFGSIRGVGFFIKTGNSFNIKGSYDDLKLSMDLTLKDDSNSKIATMSLKLKSINEFVGNFITPDGKKHYGDMVRNDNISVGCTEFADYVASYDITYPKLNKENFDLWMQSLVEEWFRINLAYINSIRYDNLDNVPEVRNLARAYGWCDVDYFSNELISGFMVFGNSWTNRQRERVFIYDLVDGKELYKENIFQQDKNVDEFIKIQIDKSLQNNVLYLEPDFKDWAATQKFDNITIRQEGINFSSTSMAYGRQGVTIPYSLLLPYLRQGGAVWKIANMKKG